MLSYDSLSIRTNQYELNVRFDTIDTDETGWHLRRMAKSSSGPDLRGALEEMGRDPSRGRGRKGPIYKWMAARYEALSRQFAHEPPSWVALAKYFAAHGLMTASGLPPTPEI